MGEYSFNARLISRYTLHVHRRVANTSHDQGEDRLFD